MTRIGVSFRSLVACVCGWRDLDRGAGDLDGDADLQRRAPHHPDLHEDHGPRTRPANRGGHRMVVNLGFPRPTIPARIRSTHAVHQPGFPTGRSVGRCVTWSA